VQKSLSLKCLFQISHPRYGEQAMCAGDERVKLLTSAEGGISIIANRLGITSERPRAVEKPITSKFFSVRYGRSSATADIHTF
jgi:hypothetical protein